MEFNDTQKKTMEVSKKISEIMGDRISSTKIYDVVHESNHYEFKIAFIAYDYFSVVFQYELDIIGCYIECGKQGCISLLKGRHCYSDTDFNIYFNEIKKELELRIPDKYLAAKGWITKV
ncbi:MAG: hypothetical protein LUI06_08100 [Ruminococcus sp.]|nr:hypothetical protein [Ruminococcus sp.]